LEGSLPDRIYECEVKRLYIRNGERIRDWKRVPVPEAIAAHADELRCAECHGAVVSMGKTLKMALLPTRSTVRDRIPNSALMGTISNRIRAGLLAAP